MRKDKIHMKSPRGWINDPNGFIYYKGRYHLFYQHFPYAPVWGTMHWGHAISKDLVNWQHLGVALFPTKYDDQNGCYSGSAVEHDGRMYLYYTGVHYFKTNPDYTCRCIDGDDARDAAQLMITSEDGFRFDNLNGKRTVVPVITDDRVGNRRDTRDPKVWRGKDAWYMVLGTKAPDGNGKLLFYKSRNLTDWELENSVEKSGLGWMWECPDYFEVEGGKVLIMSPLGFMSDGKKEESQAICMNVEFEEETCTMEIAEEYQFMDYGLDLYAPQTTLDEKGRRVLVAWLRMPEPVGRKLELTEGSAGLAEECADPAEETPEFVEEKWSGMFCIPRVVEVKDGHIYFRVHPNIERQFTRKISRACEADSAGYRLSLDLEDGEAIDVGGYRIWREGNCIHADRSQVFAGHEEYRMQFATPEVKEGFHLDIYVDPNMIEVFVNNGEYVITNTVYGLTDKIQSDHMEKVEMYTVV